MSFYNGGDAVTNGLRILYDAANVKSYPKVGTNVFNLCKIAGNGTLNNASYTGSFGGAFFCNGVNADVRTPNGSTPFLSGQFNVSAWVKFNVTGAEQVIMSPDSNGADNWIMLGSNNFLNIFVTRIADVDNRNYSSLSQITSGVPYYISVNFYTGGLDIYINGNLDRQITDTGTIGAWTNTYFWGSRFGGQRFLSGELYIGQVYDRSLTTSEVRQNFNTYRSRFGL